MVSHCLECLFYLAMYPNTSETIWRTTKAPNITPRLRRIINPTQSSSIQKTICPSTHSDYTSKLMNSRSSLKNVLMTPSPSLSQKERKIISDSNLNYSLTGEKCVTFASPEGYYFCQTMIELINRLTDDVERFVQVLSVCIAVFNHFPERIRFLSGQNELVKKIQKVYNEIFKKVEISKNHDCKTFHTPLKDLSGSSKIRRTISTSLSTSSVNNETALSLFSRFLTIIGIY
jgi:hypothetical protein